mmetsp:Transcript_18577/g.31781  ORF Transcript_18577/g.31781 Transcript_18577/m.31781 type:complete len:210 (+) Transcript_18577:402-1031(+)
MSQTRAANLSSCRLRVSAGLGRHLGRHHHLGLRLAANDAQAEAAQGAHPESLLLLRREVPGFAGRAGRQHARYLGYRERQGPHRQPRRHEHRQQGPVLQQHLLQVPHHPQLRHPHLGPRPHQEEGPVHRDPHEPDQARLHQLRHRPRRPVRLPRHQDRRHRRDLPLQQPLQAHWPHQAPLLARHQPDQPPSQRGPAARIRRRHPRQGWL